MYIQLKLLKYIFVSYFIVIFLAAFLGKELTNKYMGTNLLNEYLIVVGILLFIDITIYGFKIFKRR